MPPPYIGPNDRIPDPATLPRGLIAPPREVLDIIAREKARLAPNYGPEFELFTLNDLTLLYYFQYQTVAYRATPHGPEVLAVGWDEIGEIVDASPPEERPDVHIREIY